jgi:hypothetical protein
MLQGTQLRFIKVFFRYAVIFDATDQTHCDRSVVEASRVCAFLILAATDFDAATTPDHFVIADARPAPAAHWLRSPPRDHQVFWRCVQSADFVRAYIPGSRCRCAVHQYQISLQAR